LNKFLTLKMKLHTRNLISMASLLLVLDASANEIKSFSANIIQSSPGAQVSFTVESVKSSSSSTLWCGVTIDYGNGASTDIRLGLNGDADLRYIAQYAYPNPGSYTATVKGKGITRGLKSAIPCSGSALKVNVNVVDLELIRVQMELERTKREQAARDAADRIRVQMELERTKREQAARDAADRIEKDNFEKQKQLEAQRKEQEADAKNRELERKIKALEESKSKNAAPVRPAPPQPASKSEPKTDTAPAKKPKADSIL
jgi:flagellar biosynthesis GTPase FlhF